MGDLCVTVRFNGEVVDDRVVRFGRSVRLGEAPEARISFPGADITAVRTGEVITLRGRRLAEGEATDIALGPVHVVFEHTIRGRTPPEWWSLFDRRFLAAALTTLAVGTWNDAAVSWIDRQADDPPVAAVAALHRLVEREADTPTRVAAVSRSADPTAPAPVTVALADGPRHSPDDRLTGIGWYAWYRRAVPDYVDQVAEALASYASDPNNARARWVLGRAAYDADDFETAVEHFSAVLERYPGDDAARLRLARAHERLGHHGVAADLYEEILSRDPENALALGGLATILVRQNRLDEAATRIDQLLTVAPETPSTDLVLAKFEAARGRDDQALAALRRAMERRGQLSEELRIEMQRDLAIDPLFAALRADRRLYLLVSRYWWAAGPAPVR